MTNPKSSPSLLKSATVGESVNKETESLNHPGKSSNTRRNKRVGLRSGKAGLEKGVEDAEPTDPDHRGFDQGRGHPRTPPAVRGLELGHPDGGGDGKQE